MCSQIAAFEMMVLRLGVATYDTTNTAVESAPEEFVVMETLDMVGQVSAFLSFFVVASCQAWKVCLTVGLAQNFSRTMFFGGHCCCNILICMRSRALIEGGHGTLWEESRFCSFYESPYYCTLFCIHTPLLGLGEDRITQELFAICVFVGTIKF